MTVGMRGGRGQPCSNCGTELVPGDRFCATCGTPVRQGCTNCGAPFQLGERYCSSCGTELPVQRGEDSEFASFWSSILRKLRTGLGNDYKISRELGRGGQAAVFLAEERELRRLVAIKVLAPGTLSDDDAINRFIREARTIAALEHEHIVPIYAIRQIEGLHCFIMRYIVGRSLAGIIKDRGQLPLNVIRAIAFQVGAALQHAHRKGVLHRDVKPANILFTEDGNAIVTDFGIAKDLSGTAATHTVLMGTPAYMSPEQCRQDPLDWTCDQYALGIVLYEMLTGDVPFSGTSLEIMLGHIDREPPPIRQSRPDCPVEMEWAVLRMLKKRSAERWPTMREALDALRAGPLAMDDPIRNTLRKLALEGHEYRGSPVTPTDPTKGRTPTMERPEPALPEPPPVRTPVVPDPPVRAPVVPDPPMRTPTPVAVVESAFSAIEQVREKEDAGVRRAVAQQESARQAEVVSEPAVQEPVSSSIASPSGRDAVYEVKEPDKPVETFDSFAKTVEPRYGGGLMEFLTARRRMVMWSTAGLAAVALLLVGGKALTTGDTGTTTVVEDTSTPNPNDSTVVVDRVKEDSEPPPPPGDTTTSLRIGGVRTVLVPQDTMQLRATFFRGTEQIQLPEPVAWESRNPNIVQVDERTGRAIMLTAGVARLIGRVGSTTREVTVQVMPRSAQRVTLDGPDRITVGESRPITLRATDQRGAAITPSRIDWSVSDPSVATIDSDGRVRGVGAGNVRVEARAGSASGFHSVTVAAARAPLSTTRALATKNCSVNEECAFIPVSASGGTSPYRYTVTPALPAGLRIDAGTGAISGATAIPFSQATFNMTVTDNSGATSGETFTLSIAARTVVDPPGRGGAPESGPTAVTDSEVQAAGNAVGALMSARDVNGLRSRFLTNENAEANRRRDQFLQFIQRNNSITVRSVSIATTEADRQDRLYRVRITLNWTSAFSYGDAQIEFLFPLQGDTPGSRLRAFRIGPNPRYS